MLYTLINCVGPKKAVFWYVFKAVTMTNVL
jgi:hypothetical protein